MHNFTLRQLEYFTACIDHKSVAAAATRLNVSQPTVSVALHKLEAQMGVQLLLRHHSQGVSPTSNALKILPEVRRLLAQADEVARLAKEVGTGLNGVLRLGSFSPLAPTIVPGLIRKLRDTHPGINLEIQEGTQKVLIEALRTGQLDLAILYDLDLPKELKCLRLASRASYVALPADSPLATHSQIHLEDLVTLPLILLDVPPSRDFFLGLFKTQGLKPKIAHTSTSLELVRGMVGQGLGYSILATRPAGDLTYDGQNLAIVPLADPKSASTIVLASLAMVRPTQIVSQFAKFAAQHLSGEEL